MNLYTILYAIELFCLILQIICLFIIVLVSSTIGSMLIVSFLHRNNLTILKR